MVYTVTLNPAIDYVVGVEQFRTGTLNRASRELVQVGGKGINVSMLLNRLAVETTAMGFIAGFTGREIERFLIKEGIKTDFVQIENGFSRINVKLKSACETEINGRGPRVSEKELEALERKLDLLKADDFLVLAGSIPPTIPANFYEKVLSRLAGNGVKFIVDAEGTLLTDTLKFRPFLVKPNQMELEGIFHLKKISVPQIEECTRQLQQWGARNVLVSLGENGAVLLDEDGIFHTMEAPHGIVKNSVGAGDSMVAGFLAGWLKSNDPVQALRIGIAAGSATAFADGIAERQEIERLLSKV
ncbi:1-phosphofructokinase [uncultured Ruthenibacterium sp.]|uniref:1-phosphofructokinase n=1 Tax=uncultured Ruthenibacterium sp. TaxID=1905347 RepID=UPI00349EDCAE